MTVIDDTDAISLFKAQLFIYAVPTGVNICILYVVAEVVAGESK
jgi:hypothetical protein